MPAAIAQFTITDYNDITVAATAPVNPSVDQLWMNTSVTPNRLSRWSGSAWILATPTTAANIGAEATIYKQNSAPAHSNGRLWLQTGVVPNVLYRSTGTVWEKVTPTTPSEVGAYPKAEGENLAERVTTAEQKITSEAIINTVETEVTANGSQILATKSDITQVDNSWTAKFRKTYSGGDNLLKRSKSMALWEGFGGAIIDDTNGWAFIPATGSFPYAKTTLTLMRNRVYTFSADIWTEAVSTPNALRVHWRVANTTSWNSILIPVSVNNLKWERFDYTFNLPFLANEPEALVEFSVDMYGASSGKVWYTRPQIEVGDKASGWKPSADELYDGITKIDASGVEVSISSSSVKSRLGHDGLAVLDGNYTVASFGDAGAIVPILDANDIYCPTVVKLIGTNNVSVGSGYQYSSIGVALAALFSHGRRYIVEPVTLNVYGNLNEIVEISNLTGGTLDIIFHEGSKLFGRILVSNCSTVITIRSNNKSSPSVRGVIKPPSGYGLAIDVSGCSYVCVDGLNIAGASTYQGIRALKGGTVYVLNCDFSGITDTDVLSGSGSFVIMHDNIGSGAGWTGWTYEGGRLYATGKIPMSTNGIPASGGFIWLQSTIPTASAYSAPPVTSQVFKGVFSSATFDTLVYGSSNVDSYYGAAAAQNRWDSSMGWKQGRIRMGAEVYNFYNGGSAITVKVRLRRKNTSHGNSGAVMPAGIGTFATGALRGGWTSWATVSTSLFGAGGADLRLYNGATGANGYAIWDAIEVEVTVTKNV